MQLSLTLISKKYGEDSFKNHMEGGYAPNIQVSMAEYMTS